MEFCLSTYLGKDVSLGNNGEHERVLAVGEGVSFIRDLPISVLLYQVEVIERVVVELCV